MPATHTDHPWFFDTDSGKSLSGHSHHGAEAVVATASLSTSKMLPFHAATHGRAIVGDIGQSCGAVLYVAALNALLRAVGLM
jgi:hypothetical protein